MKNQNNINLEIKDEDQARLAHLIKEFLDLDINMAEFPANTIFYKSESSSTIIYPDEIQISLKDNPFTRNRIKRLDKITSKTSKLHRLKLVMYRIINSGEIRIANFKRKIINDIFTRTDYSEIFDSEWESRKHKVVEILINYIQSCQKIISAAFDVSQSDGYEQHVDSKDSKKEHDSFSDLLSSELDGYNLPFDTTSIELPSYDISIPKICYEQNSENDK